MMMMMMMIPGTDSECVGKGRKTWRKCVNDDMKLLGLLPEWPIFKDMWRGSISG